MSITICICTLNEENNIRKCLEHAIASNPDKLLVVDGLSDDKTPEIVLEYGCNLIISDKRGISYQRKLAIDNIDTDYVCFIDADDRLNPNFLIDMKKCFIPGIAGVMAKNCVYNYNNYFAKAMDASINIPKKKIGYTHMVGQPSMFKTSILKKITYDSSFPSGEDTYISRALVKNGYKLWQSDALNYRIHDSKFEDYIKKVKSYGKGDAKFIKTFPERTINHIYHLAINYPIIKSAFLIKYFKIQYIPFVIFIGYGRLYYCLKNLILGRV